MVHCYPKSRFRLLVAAVAFSFSLLPSAFADDKPPLTLEQVLQRHLQALGGAQALAVPTKAQRTSGSETIGGLHGTYTTIAQGLDKTWTETKIGIYDEFSGSDGKVFWERDTNGNIRLLSTEEIRSARQSQYVNTGSYLFPDRMPGKVTFRPQLEPRTGDYILDLAPEDGLPTTLYLNPKTFLLDKETETVDDRTLTIISSRYRSLSGAMVATEQRIEDGDKRDTQIITIDQIEDIPAPDTSLFAVPHTPKNFQWLHPGATSVEVPIETSDHRINMYVGLNGQPGYLFLDSGDSGFSLNLRAAELLQVKKEGKFSIRGYGGSADAFPFVLDTLEFPEDLVFNKIAGEAIPTPSAYGLYPVVFTLGAVGYDLLSRLITRVDIANSNLLFTDPEAWKPTEKDGRALPLEIEDNIPSIVAQLDDLPPARFLIDTGAPNTLKLYAPYVLKNHLNDKYTHAIDTGGAGVGGAYKAKLARVNSLTLAGVKLNRVPASLALDSKGGSSKNLAGAIGLEVLERFAFTFDYPNRRLFFLPNADASKPFDTRTFGLTILELPDADVKNKTNFLIVHVDPKAPAFHNGLNAGMTLTKIDGKSTHDLGLADIRHLLSPEGGIQPHSLTVIGRYGGTGTYQAALYDPLGP